MSVDPTHQTDVFLSAPTIFSTRFADYRTLRYMSDSNDAPVSEGDVLAGKYEVERVLGAGGMGIVVAARHIHLGGRVALKFLRPSVLESKEVVSRFTREAQAATRIKSEHVARVSDVGQLDTGSPYMVMEYLDGCDLSDVLKAQGPMPIRDAIDYLVQAMEAVGEAHSLGIVHRDLKPSNLFMTRRADDSPLIKVLDFGISKAGEANQAEALTQTTGVMGSPLYMAPEQIRSTKHVDPRADIWSLAIILYELLVGVSPFSGGDSTGAVFAAVLTEPPPSLRAQRPDVPPELEAVIFRCLAKNPAERYQNVAVLAAALAPYGSSDSQTSVNRLKRLFAKSDSAVQLVSPTDGPTIALGAPAHLTESQQHAAASNPAISPTGMVTGNVVGSGTGTRGNWGSTTGTSAKNSTPLFIALGGGVAFLLVGALVIGGLVLSKRSKGAPEATPAASPVAAATTNAAPTETAAPVKTAEPAPPPPPATSEAPTKSNTGQPVGSKKEARATTTHPKADTTKPPPTKVDDSSFTHR